MRGRGRSLLAGLVLAVVALAPGPAGSETGVHARELLVGCSTALTGPLGPVGETSTRKGLDLYLRQVNDAGGIHGRTVRTIYLDDGGQPALALANTRRLVEREGVLAVVGPQGVATVAATLDYLTGRRVPLLFPLDAAPALRGRPGVVTATPSWDRQARLTVDHLVERRGLRRLAVIQQDDAASRAMRAAVDRALGRLGLRPVATAVVDTTPSAAAAAVTAARAARAEAALLLLTPGPAAQVLKERRRAGGTEMLAVSMGPLTDERNLGIAGVAADGVEGLAAWPDPATSDLPGVRTYREHLARAHPGAEPTRASLAGYVAAMLLAEGLRQAGPAPTRAGLLGALAGLRGFETGILPPVSPGRELEAHRSGLWVRFERGRLVSEGDWLTVP